MFTYAQLALDTLLRTYHEIQFLAVWIKLECSRRLHTDDTFKHLRRCPLRVGHI